MKKVKNLLIILVLALCAVILPGKVNAAASNYKIYCEDTAITPSETTNCYLLATVDDSGIYGVYADLSFSKLTIEGVNVVGADIKAEQILKGASRPNVSATATCTADGNCYDFQAVSGLITNKAGSNGVTSVDQNNSGYTIIGYWTVKIAEDATDENCRKICASIQTKNTSTSEIVTGDSQTCTEIHPETPTVETPKTCTYDQTTNTYYDKEGNAVDEATYKAECEVTPPGTGSFASYAVLAAGAFIALSAITIAKKHNKFYKV